MSEKVREITWVAKDAELRYTPNGRPVLEFRAKIDGTYRGITYWPLDEEEGAYLASVLKKDAMVAIVGAASERKWTGADGTEKTSLEVKAYHVGPMYGKPYEGAAK